MPGTTNDDLHPPAKKDANNPGMTGGAVGLGTGTGGVNVNEGSTGPKPATIGEGMGDATFSGLATSNDPLHPGPDDDADNDGMSGGAPGLGSGGGGVAVSPGAGAKASGKKDKGNKKGKDKGKGGKKSGDPLHPGPGDDADNPGIKGGPPKVGS